jgi:hypothetical protein
MMLTRTVLLGFVLAATLIAPARAKDRDVPRTIVSSDGISCEYKYSLSKPPSSTTDLDKWWKTPHTLRVQRIECNGKDMGAADEDVDLKYRRAVVRTRVIGDVIVIVSGGENRNKLGADLTPSQIKKIKQLTWVQVLATD